MKNTKVTVVVFAVIIVAIIAILVITSKLFITPDRLIVIPEPSGITGIVLLSPTCPVMRNPPDPQCADKPYSTTLAITTPDGTRVIAQFNSDPNGKFKTSVPPGEYAIRSAATTNFYPRCNSNGSVSVKAGIFTDTTVSCDTGIR